MPERRIRRIGLFLLAASLTACSSPPAPRPEATPVEAGGARTYSLPAPVSYAPSDLYGSPTRSATSALSEPVLKFGSGKRVGGAPPTTRGGVPASGGDVTLHFESADLQEVVKTIVADILQENYEIDPEVRGSVTIHTTVPVNRDAVLPILESILQSNGAALVRGPGLYRVVPASRAGQAGAAPTVGGAPAAAGQGVRIVPLQYVSAAEMKKILDPFTVEPSKVEIDESRNVVILSGPRISVDNLEETIKIFDVDWFEGMSFGIFPVEYADAGTLSEEIAEMLGLTESGPMSGILKLIPVERLGALIVVANQPKHLKLVADLIEHLDHGTQAGPTRRLFVYNLRHSEAEEIAAILQDIFEGGGEAASAGAPPWASSPDDRPDFSAAVQSGVDLGASDEASRGSPPSGRARKQNRSAAASDGISIKADTKNNALLVLASPEDYRSVESAIQKLDVPARQVLIEATIAEVQLSDNMSYGIRWFFEWGIGGYQAAVGLGAPLPQRIGGQGLSMAIFNDLGEVRVFFDILAAETDVKFLSAPQVVVVDNEVANFRVGDQIPVVTRASQSTISPGAPIVSEVEYRDTGTLLTVKPRINAGGMVSLDISQEVSNPGPSAGGVNPPIAQRNINSRVVVHSGQTVVLGGLIRESSSKGKSGIPGLMNVPLVGGLFSSTTNDASRSELIITVTPRVIENPFEYQEATEEVRRRVKRATRVERAARY